MKEEPCLTCWSETHVLLAVHDEASHWLSVRVGGALAHWGGRRVSMVTHHNSMQADLSTRPEVLKLFVYADCGVAA